MDPPSSTLEAKSKTKRSEIMTVFANMEFYFR
jgi:hypothetical protein